MLVLGLLLVLAALAVGFGAVYAGSDSATIEVLGQMLTTTVAGVFIAGAASMLALLLGIMAMKASMGRARRKRSERKEIKSRQKASVQQLEQERAALRAENERLAEKLSETGHQPPMGATGVAAGGAAAGGAATAATERDDSREPSYDGREQRDDGREHHSGARGLMDRMTGRSGTQGSYDSTNAGVGGSGVGGSGDTATSSPSAGAGHDDRIIDSTNDPATDPATGSAGSTTDLTSREQTSTSGRHRDSI